jgi:hypothetical protein
MLIYFRLFLVVSLYTFRSFFTVMLVIGALVAKMLIIRTEYIMK